MADLKISQLPNATTLTGSEVTDGLQGGANVQIGVEQLAQFILNSPTITNSANIANPTTTGTASIANATLTGATTTIDTASVALGTTVFMTVMTSGDIWFTCNANFDGIVWNRVDESKYSYAVVLSPYTDIPGETDNTGMLFLRATPASNPFAAFGDVGGWETGFLLDQFRHLIVGGFGIEVDGSGTVPYGRLMNYSNGSPPRYVGLTSNIFVDLSGTDDNTKPSWFMGMIDDGAIIKRAVAGSTSLSQLWSLGNTGMITENAATYTGGSGTGTALLAAVNIVNVIGSGNVKLAVAGNPGQKQVVVNATASPLTVNPPATGTVGGGATVTIAAGGQRAFYAATTVDWY